MAPRDFLLDAARRWADTLAARPGVASVFLYGSLAGDPGDLTPFSDVDVALVLEDGAMPEHFAEHRLLDGVKTDTTLLAASVLQGWAQHPPSRLSGDHWTQELFLKALALGGPEIVLHDPEGMAGAAQRALPPYRTLAIPDAQAWLDRFAAERLPAAEAALAAGDPAAALKALPADWLEETAKFLAGTKRLEVAAARLRIPEFADRVAAWRAAAPPPPEVWESACDALEALGRHIEERFYPVAFDALRSHGHADPAAWEIVGPWPVFWEGNRIHTLGRLVAEWGLSRRWSRALRAQGRWEDAYEILWPSRPGYVEKCASGVRDALAAHGIDIAPPTAAFLAGPERAALDAAGREAQARLSDQPVTRAQAREALAAAKDAHRLLANALAPPD